MTSIDAAASPAGALPATAGAIPSALVVFLISRRCNLQCSYCNVDAGPHVTGPQLSLRQVEEWTQAFCSLGALHVSVQLHGGEPLLIEPPVELYAATVRNAVAMHQDARLVDIGLQSNGLLLDARRHAQLTRAAIRVNVSIDGPAAAHDRFRTTATGKASFALARRAAQTLRDRGARDDVIAVITAPTDVVPAVEFFIAEGFRGARMNPVRPEGRGVIQSKRHARTFMHEMALAYAQAARVIAAHNLAHPDRPFFEDSLAMLMDEVARPQDAPLPPSGWAFLVDDTGTLWAHPGGYGTPSLRLVDGAAPDKARALAHALRPRGPADGLFESMRARRDELFSVCATCPTPDLCRSYAGHATERLHGDDPLCTWRETLTAALRAWRAAEPAQARAIMRSAALQNPALVRTEAVPVPAQRAPAAGGAEPMHPMVRTVLDHVCADDSGTRYLTDFPALVEAVRNLDRAADARAFVQLAVVAGQMQAAGAPTLQRALAALAHIGLDPVELPAPEPAAS